MSTEIKKHEDGLDSDVTKQFNSDMLGDRELLTLEKQERSIALEIQQFRLEQRRATALSKSAFFPKDLKGDVASAVIVHDLSKRMNISEMEVSQSIFLIYGRPSFATAFLVARLNESGLIKGSLKTVISKDKQSCYCKAIDAYDDDELIGMTVTMEMAKSEGWSTKSGSKWKTMPEWMIKKRAQSFFIKEYFPQVMFGTQSKEELEDIETIDATYENIDPVKEVKEKANTVDIERVSAQIEKKPVAEEKVITKYGDDLVDQHGEIVEQQELFSTEESQTEENPNEF